MKIELSSVLLILSILAIVAGGLSWVLSKFLTDKKDKMTLAFDIERIKQRVDDVEEEIKKIEPMEREIDIIKENIKHLQ